MMQALIIPVFFAGMLTFLAPCTLPLVPVYLLFLSGCSAQDLQNAKNLSRIRMQAMKNGLFYVLGFSVVFIGLGVVSGLGGTLFASVQGSVSRIGGLLIVLFGLYLLRVFDHVPFLRFLANEKRLTFLQRLSPGHAGSAFLLGVTFAFGWTPCIGPILGSVLLLVASTATIVQGAVLLGVFSLGLAIPFLVLALSIGHASQYIKMLTRLSPILSIIGGVFLVFVGILLLTGQLSWWLRLMYELIPDAGYKWLLDYL